MTETGGRTAGASPHALEVRDVHVRFASKRGEVTALEAIDMHVERGEFVSIAGPSGCGKSTLLKVVAGLTAPSRGEVVLNGTTVHGPRPRRRLRLPAGGTAGVADGRGQHPAPG